MDTDTCTKLEKLALLKKINDDNAKSLLKLGIDMSALPSTIKTTVENFVDIQKTTGIQDMDSINLELWHLNKKDEVLQLEQGVLKPLQRKVRKLSRESEKVTKKIVALNGSIDDFKGEMIADDEVQNRAREIELVMAEAEKAITETPLPPAELDCDNLINQINALNAEKKLKATD